MDLTQILIAVSLFIVAIAISICTYYLISLIKELKNAVITTNSILDDTHKITSSVARPVSTFTDFLMGFQNGFRLFNSIFPKDDKKD
jgi:uncharacterized protein YoxC